MPFIIRVMIRHQLGWIRVQKTSNYISKRNTFPNGWIGNLDYLRRIGNEEGPWEGVAGLNSSKKIWSISTAMRITTRSTSSNTTLSSSSTPMQSFMHSASSTTQKLHLGPNHDRRSGATVAFLLCFFLTFFNIIKVVNFIVFLFCLENFA